LRFSGRGKKSVQGWYVERDRGRGGEGREGEEGGEGGEVKEEVLMHSQAIYIAKTSA
jgi:hypothetical protein